MIKIHGNDYVTVAERVQQLHESNRGLEEKVISITTEVLTHEPVVVKATVMIGENVFTGHSMANPDKEKERVSPYEIAETSAIGRALGFAGFGIAEGIASADEIFKADAHQEELTSITRR